MSEVDLSQLDDRPGSLVDEASPAEPPTPPADDPPAESTPPAADASTPEPDAVDLDAFHAKLTPEQRKAFLRKYSIDEIRTNEVVSGLVGELVNRNLRDRERQGKQQGIDNLGKEALATRDPDKALEYIDASEQQRREAQQLHSWQEATETYEFLKSDPLTEPMLEGITGKDYGAIANGNGALAAVLFESDMARNVKAAIPKLVEAVKAQTEAALTERLTREITEQVEKRYESEVKPVLQKEARAKVGLDLPPLDNGNGRPPASTPDGEDAFIAGIARTSGPLSREQMRRGAEMLGLPL